MSWHADADPLKMTRDVLHDLLYSLAEQADRLIDDIEAPTQEMGKSVGKGSDVWEGPGADAFSANCEALCIPQGEKIRTTCQKLKDSLEKAEAIVDAGDAKARQLIESGADELAAIYRM